MIRPEEIPQTVQVLAEDLVLVDWGPMTLTISAWDRGKARPVIAAQAARTALNCLATLADFQYFLRRPSSSLPRDRPRPPVVDKAFQAARRVSPELTPLAAVAGAVADQVADVAVDLGADKVIVNNGGDIAIRLSRGAEVVVGLKSPTRPDLIGRLYLGETEGIGGMASSGWRGRSFSTGVADLVTVWAENASLADAAATLVAGHTSTSGPNIDRIPARALDPQSDLGDRPVTVRVGELNVDQRQEALTHGMISAQNLFWNGLIRGVLILVQGDVAVWDPDKIVFDGYPPPALEKFVKSNCGYLGQRGEL